MTTADLLQKDQQTPFKAVIQGALPERFETKEEALDFFESHPGTCLLSSYVHGEYRVLAYKFR